MTIRITCNIYNIYNIYIYTYDYTVESMKEEDCDGDEDGVTSSDHSRPPPKGAWDA